MISKPLLTVVVPVYNAKSTLAQTIESVIHQNLNFSNHIELILVNDGSTDTSASICRRYETEYSENVKYIEKINDGVSSARNMGLLSASGKYIHFLDSDDLISKNFYTESVKFLSSNPKLIDFVASKIKFFEASINSHPNNYKFKKDRIIDVDRDPDNPIMHVSSCVFIRDSLHGFRFDENLRIAEDAKFIADVLLAKRAYGVLRDSTLYYRKRNDGSSAINGQFTNKDFYTVTPHSFYEHLLDSWAQSGGLTDYAQSEILYDLSWRLGQKVQTVLDDDEENSYKKTIADIAKRLDDRIILTKRGLDIHHRLYLLDLKHGKSWRSRLNFIDDNYELDGIKILNVSEDKVYVDFIHDKGSGVYKIEGYTEYGAISPKDKLCLRVNGNVYTTRSVLRAQLRKTFLGEVVYSGGAFEVEFQIEENLVMQELAFCMQLSNGCSAKLLIQTGPFSGMTVLPYTYSNKGKLVFRKERGRLFVYQNSRINRIKFELTYLAIICLNWRLRTVREQVSKLRRYNLRFLSWKERAFEVAKPGLILAEAILMIPRALALRLIYGAIHNRSRKPLWLISDRGMAAGDNGEAFFRHILGRDDGYADVRFVISRKSKDYDRLQKLAPGKILNQDSFRYKVMFLLADKVISSQADVEVTNPFIRQYDHYADLFDFDFIFLQHGVIRHDLSDWLNRFNKNITLFVTSAEVERKSILQEPYYYSPEQVVLTGLPRFDRLASDPARKLILAPTYRKDLARLKTNKNGARPYDHLFKESAYFEYYNRLMNDVRIVETLEKNDMMGELYLHPVFSAQTVDFIENDRFKVKDFPYDYATALREGDLLVSDYSSVVFDFAYIKKPIIYAQFDRDKFFEGHLYKKSEFFSDQHDGFGPICHDYESTVAEIIRTIEGGSVMSPKYLERVDRFFYKTDRNNSQRVYEAIVDFDKGKYSTIDL